MPSFILTGAPGAGKTAVLRLLEVRGHPVVEEAATDVIALGHALGLAEPWQDRDFIGKVLALQRRRQQSARAGAGASDGAVVFFDRSPACTLALSRYLGAGPSPLLAGEIDRAVAEGGYQTTAFFIRNQGFVAATAARRISFEDSLRFERIHEEVYRELGFRLVEVPAGPLPDRVALIRQTAGLLAAGPDDRRGSSSAGRLTGRAGWPAEPAGRRPTERRGGWPAGTAERRVAGRRDGWPANRSINQLPGLNDIGARIVQVDEAGGLNVDGRLMADLGRIWQVSGRLSWVEREVSDESACTGADGAFLGSGELAAALQSCVTGWSRQREALLAQLSGVAQLSALAASSYEKTDQQLADALEQAMGPP